MRSFLKCIGYSLKMAYRKDFRRRPDKKFNNREESREAEEPGDGSIALFPDIMSSDELIRILTEHGVELDQSQISDKSELVDIYYKTVMPLPQRKYRMNRRGKEATKNQIVRGKKRKSSSEDSPFTTFSSSPSSSKETSSSSRLVSSFNLPSTSGDRLKPPPVKSERKIISLKSSSKSGVDHIKINTISVNSTKGSAKSPTDIHDTSKNEGQKVEEKTVTTPPTKTEVKKRVIKLNRPSLSSEASQMSVSETAKPKTPPPEKVVEILPDQTKKVSTSDPTTPDDEVVSKKFKKVSITWP